MFSNNKGSALIIVYMVTAVLTILGTAFVSRALNEIRNTRRYVDTVKAFWFAEAGMNKAVYEANHPTSAVAWPGDSEISGVTVTNLTAARKLINVTGYFGDVTSTVSAVAVQSGSIFNYAAFGDSSVSLSGQGNVNSYNSTADPSAGTLLSNGDIGTNGDVSMSGGNTYVYGDAGTGADGVFEDEDHDYVSGDVTHDTDIPLPEVTVPSSLTGLVLGSSVSSSWSPPAGDYRIPDITLAGHNTVTLTGPTNLYLTSTSTAISVSGQASIVISSSSTGPVTIYTPGDISLSGQGITNAALLPSRLIIYGTSTSSQAFSSSGQSDFYGVYYAPNAGISLSGQGDLYGSFMGDTVTISGQGDIRYDEALKQINTGMGSYSIQAWREARDF
ncbi:MAG: hypothetical protein WC547_01280 [Candidatus Omnitrophota bacterium]